MRSSFLAFVGLSFIGSVFGTNADNDDPVETAFEDLKEQLCGDRDAPFYVICVSRDGDDPLNQVEIECLKILLESIMDKSIKISQNYVYERLRQVAKRVFEKDYELLAMNSLQLRNLEDNDLKNFFNNSIRYRYLKSDFDLRCAIMSRTHQGKSSDDAIDDVLTTCKYYSNLLDTLQKVNQEDELPNFASDKNSGFVIFNEYFFYGGEINHRNVISSRNARALVYQLSALNPNMIWMCNFLTKKKKSLTSLQQLKEYKRFSGKSIKHSGLTQLTSPLVTALTNKTYYGFRKCVLAAYKKNIYYDENDDFLKRKRAFFNFGDRNITSNTDSEQEENPVVNALRKVVDPYICADYNSLGNRASGEEEKEKEKKESLEERVSEDKKKFLILQSNFVLTAFDYVFRNKKDSEPTVIEQDKEFDAYQEFQISDQQLNAMPINFFPFIIHCSPLFISEDIESTYFVSCVRVHKMSSDLYKVQAQKPTARYFFKLGQISFRIEINKIE